MTRKQNTFFLFFSPVFTVFNSFPVDSEYLHQNFNNTVNNNYTVYFYFMCTKFKKTLIYTKQNNNHTVAYNIKLIFRYRMGGLNLYENLDYSTYLKQKSAEQGITIFCRKLLIGV